MNITYSLALPRDSSTIPVVRRICRDSLVALGVAASNVDDIELALSEACTNVLKHVEGTSDEFEVSIQLEDACCEIRVVDTGLGFDHAGVDESLSTTAEGGRGIFLMRAMVDKLEFVSEPEKGTIVLLVKNLDVEPHSVLSTLETLVTA